MMRRQEVCNEAAASSARGVSMSIEADAPRTASLVAELRPALVAFFRRRCRDIAEAEDLAQDVVVRALGHSESLSPTRANGYIFRIAANRWRDRGRRLLTQRFCVSWDEDSALQVSDAFSPERLASGQEELGNVAIALQQLSERTRSVLVLCRVEQMKQREIAKAMGISVSAVEKHLARALSHLARHADIAVASA
jgi:RNA polymerase sigma factor (sigma-70 family)